MDLRPDTSSGRFGGQWSFLHNTPQDAQTRSHPPSSYIRSDRSSASPTSGGLRYQTVNGSRSSLARNLPSPTLGARSTTSIPSQPVLLRVHSADASAHLHPAPRPSRRAIKMNKKSHNLPVIEEFSIKGILAAIQEDVETDINTIGEILGRSRLVLADQHDSHMPPQGEITALLRPLQAVEEASSSNERLAMDDVLILREDASMVDESQSGSAAYGLLERLQAVPRVARANVDPPTAHVARPTSVSVRSVSLPAALPSSTVNEDGLHPPRYLLRMMTNVEGQLRAAVAVASGTYLSAGTNGVSDEHDSSIVQPDDDLPSSLFTTNANVVQKSDTSQAIDPWSRTFRGRVQTLFGHDFSTLTSWLQGGRPDGSNNSAEERLRGLLQR